MFVGRKQEVTNYLRYRILPTYRLLPTVLDVVQYVGSSMRCVYLSYIHDVSKHLSGRHVSAVSWRTYLYTYLPT